MEMDEERTGLTTGLKNKWTMLNEQSRFSNGMGWRSGWSAPLWHPFNIGSLNRRRPLKEGSEQEGGGGAVRRLQY